MKYFFILSSFILFASLNGFSQTGITSVSGTMAIATPSTSFKAFFGRKSGSGCSDNSGGYQPSSNIHVVVLEKSGILLSTVASEIGSFNFSYSPPASSTPVNVYMVFLNRDCNLRSSPGNITFGGRIVGVFTASPKTVHFSSSIWPSNSYPCPSVGSGREYEPGSGDVFSVSNTVFSTRNKNGAKGDFFRIVTLNNSCQEPSGAGSIGNSQSNCGSFNPSTITNSLSGSGGSGGTPTYFWQKSTTSNSSGFSTISGATSTTYNPPSTITQTTWYRRAYYRCNSPGSVYTSAIEKTVYTIPSIPTAGSITQPTCAIATGSFTIDSYESTSTYTFTPSAAVNAASGVVTLAAGATYTFTETNAASCVSAASSNVVISAQPTTPSAPVAGSITQPTCATATGSFTIASYESTSTYTFTPSATVNAASGVVTLAAGATYTFTETNAAGCVSAASSNVVISAQPSTNTVSLNETYDVSTASYVHKFSVNSEGIYPNSVTFNNDGTKMYVTGGLGSYVNEYNLSTAFNVFTASHSRSITVAVVGSSPTGLSFNNDGTKMFIISDDDDEVNEYTLSTAFNISTASYVRNFSVATQEARPRDLEFNSDGTKMFVIGYEGDDVNEYNLSTAFNVSSAVYAGNAERFSVSGEETWPTDIIFNNDGTKMYITGYGSDKVSEYNLSTAYDVSSAVYAGNAERFSVSGQETVPTGISFNNDGTKMFIIGQQGKDVNEYNLDNPSIQTVYKNSAITNITYNTTGATGISNNGVSGANGLPAGVIAVWSSNVITISGTPTATGTFNYTIPLTGCFGSVNATGTITVENPLPIELLNFNTEIIDSKLLLRWQTATEINNDFFTIERSLNGLEWEGIEKLEGAGNSSILLSYSSIDNNPYFGISYYRLKQTDFDGIYSYSQIRSVNFNNLKFTQLYIYPNPSNGSVTIDLEETKSNVSLSLTNAIGKVVLTKNYKSTKHINFDLDAPEGLYFLRLETDRKVITKKIVFN